MGTPTSNILEVEIKHNSIVMLQKYKWNLRFVVIGKNEYKNKLKGTVLEKTPKHMQ